MPSEENGIKKKAVKNEEDNKKRKRGGPNV